MLGPCDLVGTELHDFLPPGDRYGFFQRQLG
jgi:hypothetical protein